MEPAAKRPRSLALQGRENHEQLQCCYCDKVDESNKPSVPFPQMKHRQQQQLAGDQRQQECHTESPLPAASSPQDACATCDRYQYSACKACKACQTLFGKKRKGFCSENDNQGKLRAPGTLRGYLMQKHANGSLRDATWPRIDKYLRQGGNWTLTYTEHAPLRNSCQFDHINADFENASTCRIIQPYVTVAATPRA